MTDWVKRLDAVRARLDALAARDLRGLTSADPQTGEQWEPGQVWAHLAEFGDYWLGELDKVLAGAETFGRTKADATRIAAIERDRDTDRGALVGRVHASMDALRARLGDLTDADWQRTSRHPTLGDMTVDDQMQHFHVGHYEEHAEQLESLA